MKRFTLPKPTGTTDMKSLASIDSGISDDRLSQIQESFKPYNQLIAGGYRKAIELLMGKDIKNIPQLHDPSEIAALCTSIGVEPRIYFLAFGAAYFSQQLPFNAFGKYSCARTSVLGMKSFLISVHDRFRSISESSVAKYLGIPFKNRDAIDWFRTTERRCSYEPTRMAKIFCIPAAEKTGKLAKTFLDHPSEWFTLLKLKRITRLKSPWQAIITLTRRYGFKLEKLPKRVERSGSSVEIIQYRFVPDGKKVFVIWI
jgi:hypothetical protein